MSHYPDTEFGLLPEEELWEEDDELEEEDLPKEARKPGQRQKSPGRVRLEEDFLRLYESCMNPPEDLSAFRADCQLQDLLTALLQLNTGWTYRQAARYAAKFNGVDGDMALSIGCHLAYSQFLEDKARGFRVANPVAYYQRIAHNRAIDEYFRKNFGRLPPRKKPGDEQEELPKEDNPLPRRESEIISLEALQTNSDGEFQDDRMTEFSFDPYAYFHEGIAEKLDSERQLVRIWLSELMNYPGEPQKALALMYGNVIFQTAKIYGDDTPLSNAAKASPKVSSASWAHARMEKRNLEKLSLISQKVMVRFYNSALRWGPEFTDYLEETSDSGIRWGRIVYTETYSVDQTRDWIASISKSTLTKACQKIASDRDAIEYLESRFNPGSKIRKALIKAEKEAVR